MYGSIHGSHFRLGSINLSCADFGCTLVLISMNVQVWNDKKHVNLTFSDFVTVTTGVLTTVVGFTTVTVETVV